MTDVPAGKKVNGFTGELEDAAPLTLAPSPTDQRILAAPPNDVDPVTGEGGTPLIELCQQVIDGLGNTDPDAGIDVENHVGPSLQGDPLPGVTPLPILVEQETVNEDITVKPDVQHVDVLPPNAQAVADGAEVAPIELPDVATAVQSPNSSATAVDTTTDDGSQIGDTQPDVVEPEGETTV
jgi:hypothetical protein